MRYASNPHGFARAVLARSRTRNFPSWRSTRYTLRQARRHRQCYPGQVSRACNDHDLIPSSFDVTEILIVDAITDSFRFRHVVLLIKFDYTLVSAGTTSRPSPEGFALSGSCSRIQERIQFSVMNGDFLSIHNHRDIPSVQVRRAGPVSRFVKSINRDFK
jgi:hypothetical protein